VQGKDSSGLFVDKLRAARNPASGPAVLCLRQRDELAIGQLLAVLRSPIYYCSSGREAIAIARDGALSCAIIPLKLPDTGAAKLIRALHRVAPGLAVIVIVDSPGISETVEVMRRGAYAVIDSRTLASGLLHQVAPLVNGR
jgi:DNA-binding NtrC family response regulator